MKRAQFWRYLTVATIMALVGVAILVQIIRVQGSPEVAGITGQGSYVWKTFYPARGEIYDRHGHLLAGNTTVYQIGVDLTPDERGVTPDLQTIAAAAQMALGMDPAEAMTTQTAGRGSHFTFTSFKFPSTAWRSREARSLCKRKKIGWVSGSPNRQLNSRTQNSLSRIIRPAYRAPWYLCPSPDDIPLITGSITSVKARSLRCSFITGAGE